MRSPQNHSRHAQLVARKSLLNFRFDKRSWCYHTGAPSYRNRTGHPYRPVRSADPTWALPESLPKFSHFFCVIRRPGCPLENEHFDSAKTKGSRNLDRAFAIAFGWPGPRKPFTVRGLPICRNDVRGLYGDSHPEEVLKMLDSDLYQERNSDAVEEEETT